MAMERLVGKAMSEHKDLEMISFTGSTRAGIDIQKTAAENIKRVSLNWVENHQI